MTVHAFCQKVYLGLGPKKKNLWYPRRHCAIMSIVYININMNMNINMISIFQMIVFWK